MTDTKRNGILPFQLKPNFLLQSHPFFFWLVHSPKGKGTSVTSNPQARQKRQEVKKTVRTR